jgi:hypothetical protein
MAKFRATTRQTAGPHRKAWFEVTAYLGRDLREKPLEEVAEALRVMSWESVRTLVVEPATAGGAVVRAIVRARHAGDAASRVSDLLVATNLERWHPAEAEVESKRLKDAIARWPMLAVSPSLGEDVSAKAAVVIAGRAFDQEARPPADDLLELLAMTGLTVSAGQKPDQAHALDLEAVEP